MDFIAEVIYESEVGGGEKKHTVHSLRCHATLPPQAQKACLSYSRNSKGRHITRCQHKITQTEISK